LVVQGVHMSYSCNDAFVHGHNKTTVIGALSSPICTSYE
jgi:hypothetical protein